MRYSYGATEKLLKHVNYKTRYVEDMQDGKVIEVLKIHTDVNLSDPLSKVIKVLATQRRLLPLLVDVGFLQPGYVNQRLSEGRSTAELLEKI